MVTKTPSLSSSEPTLPPLWGATLLYLGTLLATGLVISFQEGVEVGLVRLLAAVIIAGGGTLLAAILTKTSLRAIFGRIPRLIDLGLSIFIGILIWIPANWMLFTSNYLLTLNVGLGAQPTPLNAQERPLIVALQLGLIIPLCHGVLFWGFIQRASLRIGRGWGALLTALLFGVFGLVNTEFGVSIMPAWLLVGLYAAFAGYFTQSAWAGIAVGAGFGVIRPLIENTAFETSLFEWLGGADQLLEVRWLLAAALLGFLAFALLQVLRAFHVEDQDQPEKQPSAPLSPKPLWWIPLIAALGFALLIAYGEFSIRAANPPYRGIMPDSGSTIVPGEATPTSPGN